ncbi:MAG: C10 family peptidase, partial [Kiritimatiellae bacterium]|nr:C10 family peptidase [Kiritimatiellia bacterium]
MKKSFILALVALVFACPARAVDFTFTPVTTDMAMAAANAWAARNAAFGAGGVATNVVSVSDTNAAQTVLWHQVSMSGGGCLIVAPVTEIEPVVAALEDNPELSAAHPLRGILAGDIRKRLRFLESASPSGGASLLSAAPTSDEARAWAATERAKWRKLGVGGGASLMGVKDAVEEIKIQINVVDGFEKDGRFTHWNQSNGGGGLCYNYHTPNNAVCGCVATAAAAMMQFFGVTNCPSGVANKACTYNGGPIDARTIGGTYDWNLFTNCTTRADYDKLSEEQREMLGRVAYDAGVGVGMQWADRESGAGEPGIDRAYRTLFGFKNSRYVDFSSGNPTEEQMRKLIYSHCWAGVPVGVSIEGHSVVAVGYGIDADGVERVRVFMGWGGSGDAWYALPYIDTKATEGGSNYLSEVVDGLVTMLGYDTDDIVPVVGQVNMGGVAITLPGVVDTNGETRVIAADANGYFATRVPVSLSGGTLECMGKVATYTIGEAAAESTDGDELTEALPDWVMPWPLLNATVCFKLEDAIEAALAENKAVLRVSGTGGDTNTQAVLDYIYSLDSENTGDFTNRYVYIYSDSGSAAGDVSPSFGVYLPQEMDANDRWLSSNGMLTYEWRFDAEEDLAGLQATVQSVLDVGWDLYQRRSGNTVLNIVAPPAFGAGEALFTIRYEGATNTVEETPAAGVYTNEFLDGQTVTVTAAGELTNETAGVVLACSGWTLTNETTGVAKKETGSTATFTVKTNETVSLVWSVATNAVKVTITATTYPSEWDGNTVSPGTGSVWYPYGERVTFEPEAADGFYFDGWSGGDAQSLDLAEGVSRAGTVLLISEGLAPFSAKATFRRGSGKNYATSETNSVTVVSYAVDLETGTMYPFSLVAEPPETSVYAVPGETMTIADGGTVDVPAINVGFSVPSSVTDATGGVWRCVGWGDLEGNLYAYGAVANMMVPYDVAFAWYWEQEVEEETGGDEPSDADLMPVPPAGAQLLTIYSNADGTLTVEAKIANGYKGYYYSLYAADELDGTWATVGKVQSGYSG